MKNPNPHTAQWLDNKMIETLESIHRVDENGLLYYMDCTEDYYSEHMKKEALKLAMDLGCSAFRTFNKKGESLACRNYDFRHDKYNCLNEKSETCKSNGNGNGDNYGSDGSKCNNSSNGKQ